MTRSRSSAAVLLDSALALIEAGDLRAAEASCRQAVALTPGDGRSLAVLGFLLQSMGRHQEAESVLSDLTGREPQERSHWVNLGTSRRALKQLDAALAAYARAAGLGEASADFLYNVGVTHLDRLDYESARAVLERARALAPRDAEIRISLARAYELLLQSDRARETLSDWSSFERLSGDALANIAQLLFNLAQPSPADAAMQRAVACADITAAGLLTLVGALERINRLSEAQSLMERLQSQPHLPAIATDVLVARAQLAQRFGQHDIACRLFQEAVSACPEPHLRHYELFPLARSLDSLGRFEEAHAALLAAHASQVAHLRLTAPLESLRGPPAMMVTDFGCDCADVRAWNRNGAPTTAASPIFIVAFPRSGTTLLEQALDAHPAVRSMDEQPFIQNALDEILATGTDYPRGLAHLSSAALERIRTQYWERVGRKVILQEGARLLDKNPLNILRLPVIHRLFPHARIILAIRHPCDVLLSNFMQHFRAADFALLCQSLASLANGYRRTLDFWYSQVELLEPSVCELRYESLVADFDAEIRRVCRFLELPWDARMQAPAEHARRKGYISTPSYAQVVEPVSTKAVGRWCNYRRHFVEILPVLEPYLQRWGYELTRAPS